MGLALSHLSKKEIIYRATHRCRHYHTYLEHPDCRLTEDPQPERIGFLDIESSALEATFGMVLCYAILDDATGKIYKKSITPTEVRKKNIRDRNVIVQCIQDMNQFDRLITFRGTKFDLPFLRTRAGIWNLEFPRFGEIKHQDIYYILKFKFRFPWGKNSLEYACRVLLGESHKTHQVPSDWLSAMQGDSKAIKYIVDHCIADVRETQRLYRAIVKYARAKNTSI